MTSLDLFLVRNGRTTPTLEQGIISTMPPHCHKRKDISKLSQNVQFIWNKK